MTKRQFQRYCQEQRAAEEDEQRQNAYDKIIRYVETKPRCQKAELELTLALWGKEERARAQRIKAVGPALMVADIFETYGAVFEELRCVLTGELTVEGLPHLLRLAERKAVIGMQEQGGISAPKEALTYLVVCLLAVLQGDPKQVVIDQAQIHLLLDLLLGKLRFHSYEFGEDFPYRADEILQAFEMA